MAIVVGTTSNTLANSVSSLSVSNTVSSGTDRGIIALVPIRNGTHRVRSVVFNASENFIRAIRQGSTTGVGAEIWYLLNPTVTTANVVITFETSAGALQAVQGRLGLINVTGVHQTSPTVVDVTNFSQANGGNVSTSVTTTQSGDLLTDALLHEASGFATGNVGTGQTAVINNDDGTFIQHGSYKLVGAAGSYSMSWANATADNYAHVVAAFRESTGATPSTDGNGAFFAFF